MAGTVCFPSRSDLNLVFPATCSTSLDKTPKARKATIDGCNASAYYTVTSAGTSTRETTRAHANLPMDPCSRTHGHRFHGSSGSKSRCKRPETRGHWSLLQATALATQSYPLRTGHGAPNVSDASALLTFCSANNCEPPMISRARCSVFWPHLPVPLGPHMPAQQAGKWKNMQSSGMGQRGIRTGSK